VQDAKMFVAINELEKAGLTIIRNFSVLRCSFAFFFRLAVVFF
jgi:hypothetical protein